MANKVFADNQQWLIQDFPDLGLVTYYFGQFFQKPENETNWTLKRGYVSIASSLDPPMIRKTFGK